MADIGLVERLNQGVESWNSWRFNNGLGANPAKRTSKGALDLSDVSLVGANLSGVNFTGADLMGADLSGADLRGADLTCALLHSATLVGADMSGTRLHGAVLYNTNIKDTDFTASALIGTFFQSPVLSRTIFNRTKLMSTVLHDMDLSKAIDLDTCEHLGPSIIDFLTLRQSGALPITFLRGVGLPDSFIEYIPSMSRQVIQYYSCFISYSSKDQEFADRIYADLQNKGIRCWFAPHDLPIGGKILDEIDAAIRLRDKMVLILSENSIQSDWVEDEVKAAFEEERKRGQTVLFPVRLDDVVMSTKEAWAAKLRADRNIGDFRCWKDHESYKQSFARAVRDLRALPSV